MPLSGAVATGLACDLGPVTWPTQGGLGSEPREAAWEGADPLLGLAVEVCGEAAVQSSGALVLRVTGTEHCTYRSPGLW